jgi:hypothetical protein
MIRLTPNGHQQKHVIGSSIDLARFRLPARAPGRRSGRISLAGVAVGPQDMPSGWQSETDLAVTGLDWLLDRLCQFQRPVEALLSLALGGCGGGRARRVGAESMGDLKQLLAGVDGPSLGIASNTSTLPTGSPATT